MNRRTWTLLFSVVLVAVFGLLGTFARVPYVALGPGPTYDTLGDNEGTPVVRIDGERTYPTGGHLNMTTVSVTDQLSLFGALGLWASGRYALAPRELYFPPNKTEQQIEQENTKAFNDSQTSAEAAALRYLGYPMKVVVQEVVTGSPADGVVEPGDRLLEVNGQPVRDPESVSKAVARTKPGEEISIRLQRGEERPREVQVELADHPRQPGRGFIGVAPAERPDVDFDIEISLADVGGPSAGLMFALAIVDKLTPGEINGGHFVAGTGEIDAAGNVGPIGGINFKMVQAREAGAELFLVPEKNCAEAKAQAPEGLDLVKVATLDDAVKNLEKYRFGLEPDHC